MIHRNRLQRLAYLVLELFLFAVLFLVVNLVLSAFAVLLCQLLGWEAFMESSAGFICSGVFALISALVSVWLILYFRKSPWQTLGLSLKGHVRELWQGSVLIVLLYGIGFLLSLWSGVRVDGCVWSAGWLVESLVYFLLVALYEEVTMRGFVISRMLHAGLSREVALLVSAVLFALLHCGNPGISWLPFLNIVLAGIFLGIPYVYTRNLTFSIVLHWFWNWIQGPVLGFRVSGTGHGAGLLSLDLSGSAELLSGGDFGFEGSLICSFVLLTGILLLWLAYRKCGYSSGVSNS